MGSEEKSSLWKWVLGIVAIITVGAALIFGGVVIWLSSETDLLREEYNARAEESRERTYPRTPEGKGDVLDEGDAASLYQEAVEDCYLGSLDGYPEESLRAIIELLRPPRLRDASVHLEKERDAPLAASCLKLGLVESEDPVLVQLHGSLCDRIGQCTHSFSLLARGTRAENARSPLHVWDGWILEDGRQRSLLPLTVLAKLHLVNGCLRGLQEPTGEARVRAALDVLHFGVDLQRGSSLLAGMIGTSVLSLALDVLEAELSRSDLTSENAARIVASVRGAMTDAPPFAETLEAEFLAMTPLLFGEGAELNIPDGVELGFHSASGPEQLILSDARRTWHEDWSAMLAAASEPLKRRLEVYEEIHRSQDDRWNPLSAIAFADYGKYDIRFAAGHARLTLIWLFSAERLRAQTGNLLETLEEIYPDFADLLDPLTGEPFELVSEDGVRILRSKAAGESFGGRLEAEQREGLQIPLPPFVPAP